jgi:hypothetical protein
MSITYEHPEKNELGDVTLLIECTEREVTIEDSCGRRCCLEYDQIAILNQVVAKYQKMQEVALG